MTGLQRFPRTRVALLSTVTMLGATSVSFGQTDGIAPGVSREVGRFIDALKRAPPGRRAGEGARMQLYILDLAKGSSTLLADEPLQGFSWSGVPKWSRDGRRILFSATPGEDFFKSRILTYEVKDGRLNLIDLGLGNQPTYLPDGESIAFLFSDIEGKEAGVWAMDSDGSNRRKAGLYGAPLSSPDGDAILVNTFDDPTRCIVMDLEEAKGTDVAVEGLRVFSWPSWAGPKQLISALAAEGEGDRIALLDVTTPARAKVVDVLWTRTKDLDVTPRWPVYWSPTGLCIFVGVGPNGRALYAVTRGNPKAKRLERRGLDPKIGGLCFSPDGRYLVFEANRPDDLPR